MYAVIHPATPFNPMGFVETKLTLPAHWGSALINGDYDTIEDTEACVIDRIEVLFGRCVDASHETFFAKYHDATAEGVLAADCCVFTFLAHQPDQPVREEPHHV